MINNYRYDNIQYALLQIIMQYWLVQWNLSVTTTSMIKIHHLWFIQECVLMKTEDANLLLLTISAFWGSSR